MQTLYLGIDIAKLKFDCAFLSGNGKYKSKIFQNNSKGFLDLEIWLKKQKVESIHACMEATGIYREALAEHLSQNSNIIISVVTHRK
jgi:transposase